LTSTVLTKIENHVEAGLSRLIEQYKRDVTFRKFLTIHLRRVQELEDAYWEILVKRLFDTAEGAQLTAIGKIVGAERGGLSDEDFKIVVAARIAVLRSHGTPNDLQNLCVLCLPPGFTFEYEEADLTAFVEIQEQVNFSPNVLVEILVDAKLGGTRLVLLFSTTPVDELLDLETVGWGHYGSTTIGGTATCALEGNPGAPPELPGRPTGKLLSFGAEGDQEELQTSYGIAPEEYRADELNLVMTRLASHFLNLDAFELCNWSGTGAKVVVTTGGEEWTTTFSQNVIAWDPFHGRFAMGVTDPGPSPDEGSVIFSYDGVTWIDGINAGADTLPSFGASSYAGWQVECSDGGVLLAFTSNPAGQGQFYRKGEDAVYPVPNGAYSQGAIPLGFVAHGAAWDQAEGRWYLAGEHTALTADPGPAAYTLTEAGVFDQIELSDVTGGTLRAVVRADHVKILLRSDCLFLTPNAATPATKYLISDLTDGESTAFTGMTYCPSNRLFVATSTKRVYVSTNGFIWTRAFTLPDGWEFSGPNVQVRLGGIAALGDGIVAVARKPLQETSVWPSAIYIGTNQARAWSRTAPPFVASNPAENQFASVRRVGDRIALVRSGRMGLSLSYRTR
jgi:hypothetical protein